MTRVGLIARADMGGLATLTHAFFEHMRPSHTVVVDMGLVARGDNVLDYIPDADQTVEWARWRTEEIGFAYERMVGEVDVIYTAETVYDPRLYALAHARRRVPIVLHAMPELLSKGDRLMADAVWFPTSWYTDENDIVMPVPVDLAPEPRRLGEHRIFFHTCGEAMLDRNGTEIVREAMAYVEQPLTLLLRCGEVIEHRDWKLGRHGNVTLQFFTPTDHYRTTIPRETEVLLMPRRYGGLCLPVQEAAARGIPSIMSDLAPQNRWPGVATVPATPLQRIEMKGGWFPNHAVDPREYAKKIDAWADPTNAEEVAAHAKTAHEWARALDWNIWRDRYAEALTEVAERVVI